MMVRKHIFLGKTQMSGVQYKKQSIRGCYQVGSEEGGVDFKYVMVTSPLTGAWWDHHDDQSHSGVIKNLY